MLWRNNYAAASEHLREYLASSTDTRGRTAVGRQLNQLREAQQAVDRLSASASASEVGPQTDRSNNEFNSESFREHNRPLLETISTYTCMETICPLTREPGSSTLITETFRVDVALSGGNEIYGAAGDTRFSSKSEGELLGSLRTTGLFNTVAKSLMFADQVAIEPAGVVKVYDVTLFRFNFYSLKQHAGWSITSGNQTASVAERGWFLVDSETQLLRRVFVAAVDIPGKLGLISLNALIDYDVSTIASHRALLPVSAKVDIGESSGRRLTSFMSFAHCRAFTAESELYFDQSSYDLERAISNVHHGSLPADLDVVVSLKSPLTLAAPTNSDVIIGRVVKPVTSRGRVLIEAGSGIEGHVRRKTGESALVIELDRVHGKNGWVPFYASLRELGVAKDIHIRSAAQDYEYLVAP